MEIAIDVIRAVLLDMIMPTLRLKIDSVEEVYVEADPNKPLVIIRSTFFF